MILDIQNLLSQEKSLFSKALNFLVLMKAQKLERILLCTHPKRLVLRETKVIFYLLLNVKSLMPQKDIRS